MRAINFGNIVNSPISWDFVSLGDGRWVPPAFSASWSPDRRLSITIDIVVREGGEPKVKRLSTSAGSSAAQVAHDDFPSDAEMSQIVGVAFRSNVWDGPVEPAGTFLSDLPGDRGAFGGFEEETAQKFLSEGHLVFKGLLRKPIKRSRLDKATREGVAKAVRHAQRQGVSTRQTVADRFGISLRQAKRWIEVTRREGDLGTASPRRPGEAPNSHSSH